MIRKILITALAMMALVAAPAAAQYEPIVVQPGRVPPGGTVTVTGSACAPGDTVVITLQADGPAAIRSAPLQAEPVVVATVTADAEGNFSASFVVPADAKLGWYTVTATCGSITRHKRIQVAEADTPATTVPSKPGGNLPKTGSNLNGFGLAGAGLLAVGGLFLLAANKRRTADA